MFNNLIYCDAANSAFNVDNLHTNGFQEYNNLIWNRAGSPTTQSFNWGGGSLTGFANWIAIPSRSTNSVFSNPYMQNVTNGLFRLQSISPAINFGVATNTIDILGKPIWGRPDAGAYEFQPTGLMF